MLIEKPLGKVAGDTFSRATIPKFGNSSLFSMACKDNICFLADYRDVATDHRVGALFDRDWTLGIFAEGETGNTERRRFFLQATGIGEYDACACHQAEHFQITLRRQQNESCVVNEMAQTKSFDVGFCPRVQRKNQR